MLTIEQRAARAAKKRNRKIAQAYPLFADQFAVSVESQVERLKAQDVEAAQHLERHRKFDEMQFALGMKYREIAKSEMQENVWQDLENRYQRIFGKRDISGQAAFLADWWHCALRDNNSAWLQNNCPMSEWHALEVYQRAGRCPCCGRKLFLSTEQKKPEYKQRGFIHSK